MESEDSRESLRSIERHLERISETLDDIKSVLTRWEKRETCDPFVPKMVGSRCDEVPDVGVVPPSMVWMWNTHDKAVAECNLVGHDMDMKLRCCRRCGLSEEDVILNGKDTQH